MASAPFAYKTEETLPGPPTSDSIVMFHYQLHTTRLHALDRIVMKRSDKWEIVAAPLLVINVCQVWLACFKAKRRSPDYIPFEYAFI